MGEEEKKALGNYLRECRTGDLRRRVSQAKVAEEAGITEVQYQRIETGHSGTSIGVLVRLVRAVGGDMDMAFSLARLPKPPPEKLNERRHSLGRRREDERLMKLALMVADGGVATQEDVRSLREEITLLRAAVEALTAHLPARPTTTP